MLKKDPNSSFSLGEGLMFREVHMEVNHELSQLDGVTFHDTAPFLPSDSPS